MYLDYLKERFEETDLKGNSFEDVANDFERLQKESGNEIFKTSTSFVTYRLIGDAIIVDDIYVKPEARTSKEAKILHNALRKLAYENDKRVGIGFSLKAGKNRDLGIRFMKSVGFIEAYETADEKVYITGV